MRIRSLLVLTIFSVVIVVLIFGLIMLEAHYRLKDTKLIRDRSDIIAEEVAGQLTLILEFSLYGEERAINQWQARNKTITKYLELTSNSDYPIPETVKFHHDLMLVLFQQLIDIRDQKQDFVNKRREQLLLDQLLSHSQVVIDKVYRWHESVKETHDLLEQKFHVYALVSTLLILIFILYLTSLIGLRILKPLKNFQNAVKAISKGELSVRASTGTKDEIGMLSEAFDIMAIDMVNRLNLEIEERKKTEEKIWTIKERLEAAASAGIVGVWDWDVVNDNLVWDEIMCQLYGLRKEDFSGVYEAWSSALHPEDKTFTEGEIQAALRGERDYAPEFRVIWPDGSIHYIKAKSHTTFDGQGKPLRMVGINYDITEQKNKQLWLDHQILERTKELRQAHNEADAANKAKSIFLSNMSHELRTPMHAIMSFSSLGIKRTEDDKVKRYLENIHTSGERLTKLLDDLLDLSKLESGKLIPEFVETDLTNIVYEVIDEIGVLVQEKNILLDFKCNRPCLVQLDKKLITQVIVNLISNAIKFSPEGSEIKISISENKNNSIVFSVVDDGIGIPKDELKDVFDSFVQSSKTRSDGGGTGLGLPISKEIIELHNGKIWAESPPKGKEIGTVFYFQIPNKQ